MATTLGVLTMTLAATAANPAGDCVPVETAILVPDDLTTGALFGTEIAAVGGAAVASAIAEPASSGSLFVLTYGRDGWRDVARLLPSDLGAGPFSMALGWSVAMDEGIILGGAPFFDIDGVGFGGEGAVFVFRPVDGVWEEQAILIASDPVATDLFGLATAVRDDLAVIGAPGVDDDAGAAYIFRFDGAAWNEEAKLTGSDTVAEDGFGLDVACDGRRVYVGAVGDAATEAPGRVYVFEHDGGSWCETALLHAWDTTAHNGFGAQVDVEADRMIVGATGDDERGLDAGAAYVFEYDGTTWQAVVKLTASDSHVRQAFGVEVGIRGDCAIVNAHLDDELGFQSGAAYVFREDAEGWTEAAKLTASDGAQEHRFGDGLAFTGDALLIGAPFRDGPADHSGAVYAFDLCACPSDVDGDGIVGFPDVLAVLSHWGPCAECAEDVDGDGDVGFSDLLEVLSSWGPCGE